MRQQIVMGNWKMNGHLTEVTELLHSLLEYLPDQKTKKSVVVFPPAVYLSLAHDILKASNLELGAQNIYPKVSGAYTGEISVPMVKDFNCRYILVGHSERRQLFKESENFVAEKFHHVKNHDMIPVLCVGETLEERERRLTEQVLSQQLFAVAQNGTHSFENCIVAYEPVWAIGTGKTATPEQAQEIHAYIRALIAEFDHEGASKLPIVYGGSVNDSNAAALFAMPDIDGGLVGGASLNAQQFLEIAKCINYY